MWWVSAMLASSQDPRVPLSPEGPTLGLADPGFNLIELDVCLHQYIEFVLRQPPAGRASFSESNHYFTKSWHRYRILTDTRLRTAGTGLR
jgi:hypothetical protein